MDYKTKKRTDAEKFCPSCEQWKRHGEFYINKDSPGKPRGYCKECNRDRSKAYVNSLHYKAARGPQGKAQREMAKRATLKRKHYRAEHPDWLRWEQIERSYGLTKERWCEILEEQHGACAICLHTSSRGNGENSWKVLASTALTRK